MDVLLWAFLGTRVLVGVGWRYGYGHYEPHVPHRARLARASRLGGGRITGLCTVAAAVSEVLWSKIGIL